jgi:hypothetical protein
MSVCMFVFAVLDRLYPFGGLYGDVEVPFTDRDDGYMQFILNDKFLFGAVYYDSIFVSCFQKRT